MRNSRGAVSITFSTWRIPGKSSWPIRAQVLQPALPPVGLFFKYLVELSLGYAVTSPGFNEHLPAYASVTQSLSNTFCNLLAGCECASVNCDDRHNFSNPFRIQNKKASRTSRKIARDSWPKSSISSSEERLVILWFGLTSHW